MLNCRVDLLSVSLERPVPVYDLVLALVELKEALYALEVIVPVLLVRQEVIHRPETRSNMFYIHTLQRKSHLCIPFLGIAWAQSQFPNSCVCERFIYYQDRSTYFSCSRIGSPILEIYKSPSDI
jgi:hypothetical protein